MSCQLVEAQLRVWKRSTMTERTDGITILHPKLQEIWVIDSKTAHGILLLKESEKSVRYEIYSALESQHGQAVKGCSEIPLEILIYGPMTSVGRIGTVLSNSDLFLQEPSRHQLSVPYRNPHVLSWDDDSNPSYLLWQSLEGEIILTDEINAILDGQDCAPQLIFEVEQDPRMTLLKP